MFTISAGLVYTRKSDSTSLTAAIRVFLMLYYRAATTESGHIKAGHGDFENMKQRARIPLEYEKFFERKGGKRHASMLSRAEKNDNLHVSA